MSSVIIEQTNPVAPSSSAVYSIKQGNASFNDFILSYPRGAYSGMRTVDHGSILELTSHLKRITNSLALMKFTPPNQAEEPDSVNEQMSSFRRLETLEDKLVPLIHAGLLAYYDLEPQALEAKVSVMVTYCFDLHRPCFAVHVGHLGQPSRERIKVVLDNKARTMPAVKDSQWVRDRASLEKNKGQEINEVVLIDDSENVYEGMASNFFAVRRRQHDDEEGVNKSDYVIQCASLDHVLLGTIMKLVMALCEKEKIDIEWVFPRLQDARAGKWEGCFLTSTSRLLLPIETIYSKDGSAPIEFPPSEFIQQLQEKVIEELKNRSYSVL